MSDIDPEIEQPDPELLKALCEPVCAPKPVETEKATLDGQFPVNVYAGELPLPENAFVRVANNQEQMLSAIIEGSKTSRKITLKFWHDAL